ncbi:AAA family ATPase [Nostoc sp. ChiQUE01b]|uniref:AAA family ATPase n=1 Tax=Nostoc sp. ChiQUE01b TaxID=3075376 RepID=UPI002AD23B55|nr:AAA family ATPase [Nostoc sp. ChiQUE01b]MDZ8260741.1 AAA family ATPase [Nostoc sp. ChiQUE01b]
MAINYSFTEKVYESANSLVYRAILKPDNKPVILKILKENYPTSSELTRYKQEYEITRSLNVDGIIKAYDLERYENSLVMLLEDFGGQSLKLLISQSRLSLEDFLAIAIKITESLGAIHTTNIIHKDINPSNIVYNSQTEQLKIIDFGISTRLSQEFMTVFPPNQLEGTLAYIAPEQTGRMNRGIDYRSDFYSLGVTFYELITNQLPFNTTDPIELVHCHIAQQPLLPHELISDIPLAVSNIIGKLLAKTPEERYQSAWGIKADLETCLNQLKTLKKISQFPLGSQDITEKLHITQKLYGREQEVTQLLTAFEKVSQGATEMLLISGYSGIGKSALVNEIHKPVTRQRGQFISGKFDQLKRDIPYSAISQAFQGLIHKLLSESETTLQAWKNKILEALGNNGQIIIDVIPEVEKIIGQQPLVEQLGRTESQNRFNLLFQRFFGIFCQQKHPLVIFLDDLQWADLPSMTLIEQLMSDPDNQYFLIIGAYRDNEVSPTHPLVHTLEKINHAKVPVNDITLAPLKINQINQLVADTLICSTEVSQPLAELVAQKTGGNPFFLTQLLYSLYQDNLLVFNRSQALVNPKDNQQGYWQWSIEQIESVSITDNVVDLMVSKIEKLDQKTQQVLKLAACIGNHFNLEILSIVNNKSTIATARELQPALHEGLIIPLNDNYKVPLLCNPEELSNNSSKASSQYSTYIPYKFLHDRVQQAAYFLIPEEEKKQAHLQIGRLLLKSIKENELQNNIFDIINQLNEGSTLITEQLEKDELAKLNLQAGKKAKVSTAYEPALRYLETGLELLEKNSWEHQYQLTLELHIETLEALYLNTKFEQIEELAAIVLQKVEYILDQVKVYELKILSYYAQFQPEKAIDTAIAGLGKLGIKMSQEVVSESEIKNRINREHESLKSLLQGKRIEDLADLPKMTDPYKQSAISILQPVMSATWTINFSLFVEIILTQLNICLNYNNPPQSAAVYGAYGMLLCAVIGDIDFGYQFGKLSIILLEKYNISKLETFVQYLYYVFIRHWKEPINDSVAQQLLLANLQQGLNTGNNEYVCYIALSCCYINLFGGGNLENLLQDSTEYTKLIKKLNQEYSIKFIEIVRNTIANLRNSNQYKHCLLLGNSHNEEDLYLEHLINQKNQWLLFAFYFGKMFVAYFQKYFYKSFENGQCAEEYVLAVSGGVSFNVQHNFYSSLSFLAYHHNCAIDQQKTILEKVEKNQQDMKIWAGHCPANFQNKYDLVEAEKARVLGENWEAQELYEKAIQGAKKSEFIHEEAIAYERAAEFYLSLGRQEIGRLYLKNAYHCYSRWGAKAKVQALESEYPQFLMDINDRKENQSINTTESSGGTNPQALDIVTVTKASQILASEIKLDQLLAKLMKTVIENGGAQKGFLILEKDRKWVIAAESTVDSDDVTLLRSLPIDSVDGESQTPILPVAIINYVVRTQENVVLNNATVEEQFIRDRYIVATQPKSILCTPLLHQGKLSGILYLENNLTTDAFTSDRIEVLRILSAQAAISIENARLYGQLEDYNRNLELRVEERTQELSQTLEVLKATQAELLFENELLKSGEQPSTFDYQVGGSLAMGCPTYVVRSADRYLYKALKRGEFCYILNPRQMGKSSLMVRMIHHLQHEGFSCGAIDLTRIGSENVTPEQWYKGLTVELWRSFGLLRKVNLKTWWQEQGDISPVQRLSQFIEEILLVEVAQKDDTISKNLIIFIDEIDSFLSLNFPVNDFFALIRSCYNQRSINPEYRCLTFAIFGVATPSDLITDHQRTPFNIGQTIQLEGFKEHEAQPLLQGLTEKVSNPQTVLKEVLAWTNGQPFLTQKLCKLIRNSSSPIPTNREAEWIENLVRRSIIENWESQDEPEHLRTIRDRLLKSKQSARLLELYRQILYQGEIVAVDSSDERELLLSGLVVKQQGNLRIQNRIYESIFV